MWLSRRFRTAASPLALVVLLLSSCASRDASKPVFPVKGKVLWESKAATGALVLFHPRNELTLQGPRPHGRVKQDGTFVLTTYREEDGAPAGDYVVTIDWRQGLPHGQGSGRSLLPPEYGSPESSPLQVTVREGSNELPPFTIDR